MAQLASSVVSDLLATLFSKAISERAIQQRSSSLGNRAIVGYKITFKVDLSFRVGRLREYIGLGSLDAMMLRHLRGR